MKTLNVGIASYEDMKAHTMAIAKGELRPEPGDPLVWFTSPESFAKVLSNHNRALLAQIADTHPASLHDLALSTGRRPATCRARSRRWNATVWSVCTQASAAGFVRRCLTAKFNCS